MPVWEIDKIKNTSKSVNSKFGKQFSPWVTWKDEMIKKTVIKRHFKMLISLNNVHDSKINALLEIENENNGMKETFNQKKSGLGNAFVQEEENDKGRVDERIAMLIEEKTEPIVSKVKEFETEDLISDADVIQVDDNNIIGNSNLFDKK